jgi:hypothetical protein
MLDVHFVAVIRTASSDSVNAVRYTVCYCSIACCLSDTTTTALFDNVQQHQ